MHTTPKHLVRLALPALLIAGAVLYAGPLNPPAGPIASTGKTLGEVEPRTPVSATTTPGNASSVFIISQPGSYYLTGNITGVAGRNGITITTTGVTLDLNGFEMVGVAGSLDGIVNVLGTTGTMIVRNGTLRGWGGYGLNFSTTGATTGLVEKLVASENTIAGIRVDGGIVRDCVSNNNVGSGFIIGAGSVITDCVAYVNGATGITTASGCTVSHNSVRSNTTDGISVFGSCLVLNNTCSNNGVGAGVGANIRMISQGNRIEGNVCNGADRGIQAAANGNVIIRNTCRGATIANWDIAANNIYGPIIDRSAPATAAFTGNAAASTLGSTDPHANFTY